MEEGTFGSGPYVEVSIGLFTQGGIFMAFSIVHGDIVQMGTDAIVNAANSGLLAGSGVCGAIFHAVGPRARELQEACLAQAPCPTGQSVLTDSYGLKAKYIIHTVGPIWQGGQRGERNLLASCYATALELAASHD